MRLRYDEDFVEAAVLLCIRDRRQELSSLHLARFNREREKLYGLLDPDDRNAAFFRFHLDWFREWGLEQRLTKPLTEFRELLKALQILAFRKSRGNEDDAAELYVNEAGERNGVLALRPERLVQDRGLPPFLRHELTHLRDMVDPDFGYAPDLHVPGPSLNQQRLARERYRALWDVTIDGRLTHAGRQTVATREQRHLEFSNAFSFWPETRQQKVFEELWSNPSPTHHRLVELVCDPQRLQSTAGPRPGAPCPLCGFPTFVWADGMSLAEGTVAIIRSEFPHWSSEHGACNRCVEIYRQRPRSTLNATTHTFCPV